MIKNLFLRYGLIVTAISAMAFTSPADQAGDGLEGRAASAVDVEAVQHDTVAESDVSVMAFPTPSRRTYHITSSCSRYAAAIKKGAAAWSGLTEGGGTPVSCTNSYIRDCGGSNVVGCNYGQGQRITLFISNVRDGALLAAHEFGHNWFGHSNYSCTGWSSASHVMGQATCG